MHPHVLRAHAAELCDRCRWIADELDRRRRPELEPQLSDAQTEVQRLAEQLETLIDGDIDGPAERASALSVLRTVGRELELQGARLALLLRAGAAERRVRRFVIALAEEVAWPLTPPLVSCASSAGWWADPEPGLIYLPAGEERRLLGLPDLLHEMAHSLYSDRPETLVGDFLPLVADYVEADVPSGAPYPPGFPDLVYKGWIAWLMEFTCDLVAAYACGPSFAWQNLRLAATMSRNIFHPVPPSAPQQHPADAARMMAICAMLDLTVGQERAHSLRRAWADYEQVAPDTEPLAFRYAYPAALVQELAGRVYAGCRTAGIKAFQQAPRWPPSALGLLDLAWRRFLNRPDGFGAWERRQVSLSAAVFRAPFRYSSG
ncbi:MAG: hypothetical protein JWN32_1913 [Solirubrobacterales bacterium]|nr:hypothetical protein [Solirubrobacterales bacterium]